MILGLLSLRARIVLLSTLLVMFLVLSLLSLSAWELRQENNGRRAEIEPRIARFLGVHQQHETLRKAVDAIARKPSRLLYSGAVDMTKTGTLMQKEVRSALSAWGVKVVASKVLAVKSDQGVDLVGLSITAEASMEALESLLLNLSELRPVVLLKEITLTPKAVRGVGGVQQLSIRMRLVSLRLHT